MIEAVAQRCSVKKVFFEISQNSQENTCAEVSFLIKLQACYHHIETSQLICYDGNMPATLKKETSAQVFSVNFVKFLRTPFLKDHLWWLLLQ